MIVLGIESTAHTFGVGIIDSDKKKILFNEKSQFVDDESGMDLRKLSDFHVANFDSVLKKAKSYLNSINLEFSDLDLISFSRGPGLANSLKIGALVAKTLSLKYGVRVVGVSHIKAHLEIGKMLTGFSDPMFLYVSGVNTQIIAKDGDKGYKIYGETEDIGLGNLIDTFARDVGLGFPGGPLVEKLAKNSNNYIELPYSVKGMNISLAGLSSNLKQKIQNFDSKEQITNKNTSTEGVIQYHNKEALITDLCYSIQETCFAMVLEVVERAMAYTNKKEFIIVGGVACNKRLEEMARAMCKHRNAQYDSFPIQYAMDNGAMIAWQGFVDKEDVNDLGDVFDLKPLPYITVESEIK